MSKQTLRKQIISLLSEQDFSALELSQLLGIPEKDVYGHVPHIARSLSSQNRELAVIPSVCLKCEYQFDSRKRFTKPGRCPRCRGERIQEPRFKVTP